MRERLAQHRQPGLDGLPGQGVPDGAQHAPGRERGIGPHLAGVQHGGGDDTRRGQGPGHFPLVPSGRAPGDDRLELTDFLRRFDVGLEFRPAYELVLAGSGRDKFDFDI